MKRGTKIWAWFFGGTEADDAGVGIVTNGSNDAFVTGYTNSTRFPDTQADRFIGTFATSVPWGFITEVTALDLSVGTIVRCAVFDAPLGSVTPTQLRTTVGEEPTLPVLPRLSPCQRPPLRGHLLQPWLCSEIQR